MPSLLLHVVRNFRKRFRCYVHRGPTRLAREGLAGRRSRNVAEVQGGNPFALADEAGAAARAALRPNRLDLSPRASSAILLALEEASSRRPRAWLA